MRAEDLHIGPVITWWNDKSTWRGRSCRRSVVQFDRTGFNHLLAGEDERKEARWLYFNLPGSRCRSPARSASIRRRSVLEMAGKRPACTSM